MKKLRRTGYNKKIAGVCGAFADYFDLDPTLIRIIWACSILLGGTGLLAYLICWLLIPLE